MDGDSTDVVHSGDFEGDWADGVDNVLGIDDDAT